MSKNIILLVVLLFAGACSKDNPPEKTTSAPAADEAFNWNNSTVYFLLTDRFHNGNPDNDVTLGRTDETAVLRGFMGGDLAGITQKINDGYFSDLGVTAIWFTPPVEQVHGSTDEGTGVTYGYHGYWARDWTALDPNFGTIADLTALVEAAHANGIRIVLDVVLNHTGPVTNMDSVWPDAWVRTEPTCTFQNAETTIECTLVDNLPDIRTDSQEEVELPEFLVEKWKEEGRYDTEMAELEEFFSSTGLPRAPKYYIMKWLRDFVIDYGVDGFRVDTAKHTEADVWGELHDLVAAAFEQWKAENPDKRIDDSPFYMVGEVYNYSIGHGRAFPMGGDDYVDFFAEDFDALINFAFKYDAARNLDSTYAAYSQSLTTGTMKEFGVLNYLASHDDGSPFDPDRSMPKKAGTYLLLAPGGAQVYYGDELARPLTYEGAAGDAHLRTYMNWEDLEGSEVFHHWSKLGQFRRDHVAVGAGVHQKIADNPYTFSRTYKDLDKIVVAMDASGALEVGSVFPDDSSVRDAYSGEVFKVTDGKIELPGTHEVVLLEAAGKI